MTNANNGVQRGHAAVTLKVNDDGIEPKAIGAWTSAVANNVSLMLNVPYENLSGLTLRDIRDDTSDLHDVITILDAGAAGYFVYAAVDTGTLTMLSGDCWDDLAKLVLLAQAAGADYLHITDAPAFSAGAFDLYQDN